MKARIGIFGIALLAVMMIAGVAVAASNLVASNTDTQNVYRFDDGSDTGGVSNLTRTEGMVLATVEAAGLTPGDVYTVWWVVFNNPDGCEDGCGEDDLQRPAAEVGIGNATGNIAKADGSAEFGAVLKRNDTSGAHQILLSPTPGGAPLTVSGNDAEVHLVIQNHGRARGGPQLLGQLTNVATGCTPFCEDVQFAVHQP